MTNGTKAALVSFAGLDGAGKTTQAGLLADWLTATGFTVGLEAPQGPSFIRSVLTQLASDLGLPDHHEVFGPDVTYLLTAFMRYRDWAERVVPALRTHQWMVTDRSAVCYYAAACATGATNEETLRLVMRRLPVPDLILFLDVTPEEAFSRLERRNAGREEAAFLAANERGYHQLPEFAGFTVVPGSGSIPEVHARVRHAVSQRFPELLTILNCGGLRKGARPAAARTMTGRACGAGTGVAPVAGESEPRAVLRRHESGWPRGAGSGAGGAGWA